MCINTTIVGSTATGPGESHFALFAVSTALVATTVAIAKKIVKNWISTSREQFWLSEFERQATKTVLKRWEVQGSETTTTYPGPTLLDADIPENTNQYHYGFEYTHDRGTKTFRTELVRYGMPFKNLIFKPN
jgi:hypothetical protein